MRKFLTFKIKTFLLIIIIFGFLLRTYGINWDQNHHLHPDERFLTMVTQSLKISNNFWDYLNPNVSTLNPYNAGYTFFVYGTFPTTLVKIADRAVSFRLNDYNHITLLGRLFSAIGDTLTILLIYLIARQAFSSRIGLLSAGLYSLMVLPIQLSHFFAVDTFLTFFLTLTFLVIIKGLSGKNPFLIMTLSAFSYGLALACKISAIYLLPIVFLAFLFMFVKFKNKFTIVFSGIIFILLTCLSYRFFDPKTFSPNILLPKLNPLFVSNLTSLSSFAGPDTMFPPAIQWIKTKALIFPLNNIVLWGLGLPLGIVALSAIVHSIIAIAINLFDNLKKYRLKLINHLTIQQFSHILILSWILIVFLYEGTRFSKTMRYFYPVYPFLAIITANFIYLIGALINKRLGYKVVFLFFGFLVSLFLIWPLSFIQLYSRPHSRVTASKWIYQNIPPGSTLSCEHWDDCLPLSIGNGNPGIYNILTLEMYNPDNPLKWKVLNEQLDNLDYLILSSNRVWGSIPAVPEKYPLTAKFYNDLFNSKLNFEKIAEFTSFPTVPILNIPIDDSSSEEAFTVYDHPKIMVFKNRNLKN